MAKEKILVSWSVSSSKAPMPSESIIMIEHRLPSFVNPSTGLGHIHKPLVQGFTVGPTENPLCLFKKTLFNK